MTFVTGNGSLVSVPGCLFSSLFSLLQPEIRVNQDVSQERTTVYSHSPFNCRSIKEALTVSLFSRLHQWLTRHSRISRKIIPSRKRRRGRRSGRKKIEEADDTSCLHFLLILYLTLLEKAKTIQAWKLLSSCNDYWHSFQEARRRETRRGLESRAFFLWLSVPNILYWCLIIRQDLPSVFVSVARILLCQHTLSPSIPLPSRLSFQSTSWYSSLLLLPLDGREKERKRLLLLFFFNRLLQADDSVHLLLLLETESQASAETQYKRPAVKVNEEAK